jgi:hypothetical protein
MTVNDHRGPVLAPPGPPAPIPTATPRGAVRDDRQEFLALTTRTSHDR